MARRVDTKFATILAVSAVVAVGGVWAAQKFLRKRNPEQFVSIAKQADQNKQWRAGADAWRQAITALSPEQNAGYLTSLGEDLHNLSPDDPDIDAKHQDYNSWTQALEVDPTYVRAAKDLYRYWHDLAINPQADVSILQKAHDAAVTLHTLAPNDPDDAKVVEALYMSVIEGYLRGLNTDDAQLQDAMQHVRGLMVTDPTNADLPFALARVYLHQGMGLVRGSQLGVSSRAAQSFGQAVAEMESVLKNQPDNALMNLYAAQVYTTLADTDNDSRQKVRDYLAQATRRMDRAWALLKGDEGYYVPVALEAAEFALRREHNPTKAATIMGKVMDDHSRDPEIIAQFVPVIGSLPDLRPRAIDILQRALADSAESGAPARRQMYLNGVTYLRILEFQLSHDPAERDTLRPEIRQNLQDLTTLNLNPLYTALMTAKMDLADNNPITAIQILTDAASSSPSIAQNPDIIYLFAQAYDASHESQQAIEYLLRTIQIQPTRLEARSRVIELLMNDTTMEGRQQLQEQLQYLVKNAPGDPTVMRLEILTLDRQIHTLDPAKDADEIKSDAAELKTLYARFPEDSIDEVNMKCELALNPMNDSADAVRLMKMAVQAYPKDLSLRLALIRTYALIGKRDLAIQATNEALVAMPDAVQLKVIQAELTSGDPSKVAAVIGSVATQDPNATERERMQAQLAAQTGDVAAEETHLLNLLNIAPNDQQSLDTLFQLYCIQHKFKKAEIYCQKLVDLNADQCNGLVIRFHLAQARQDSDAEMDLANKLVSQYPEFARSFLSLGIAFQAKGNYDQAISNYQIALQKAGDLPEAFAGEVQCLNALQRTDDAYQAIQSGLKRFPGDSTLQTLDVDYQMRYGNPEIASIILEHQRLANLNDPMLWLKQAQAEVAISGIRKKNGDADGFAAHNQAAGALLIGGLKRFPDDTRFYQALTEVYLTSGDRQDAEQTLVDFNHRPAWQGRPEPLLMLADFYWQFGDDDDYKRAMSIYNQALEASHHDPQVVAIIAQRLAAIKQYDAAVQVLEADNTNNPALQRLEIGILQASSKPDRALALIARLLAGNPPDASDLHRVWGNLLLNEGNLTDAATQVDTALTLDPHNFQALLLRAKLRLEAHPPDLDGALADLTAAHAMAPKDTEILAQMADIYNMRFDVSDAELVLDQALHTDPSRLDLRLKLAQMYVTVQPISPQTALNLLKQGETQPGGATSADLANEESYVYEQLGRPDDALHENQAALQINPNSIDLKRCRLDLLLAAGQYANVLQESDALIGDHKDLWWLWSTRGQARAAGGDGDGAMREFAQALNAAEAARDMQSVVAVIQQVSKSVGPQQALTLLGDRNDPTFILTRLHLLQAIGDYKTAVSLLDSTLAQADKMSGSEKVAFYSLAGDLYGAVTPVPLNDKAYAAYKQALAVKADNLVVLNNLACLCADGFNPPRAEEGLGYIQKAMDLLSSYGTTDPRLRDTHAWLLILSGQVNKGVDELNDIIAHQPFPDAYYHLAYGYFLLNNMDQAQQVINQAYDNIAANHLKLDPGLRVKMDNLSNRIMVANRNRAG